MFIDKLEEWANEKGDGGVNIASIILRIHLYADDVTLDARMLCNLQEHLLALETFREDLAWKII